MKAHPSDPIRGILVAWTSGATPPDFVRGYTFKNLSEHQMYELQSWCAENSYPNWVPGCALMDAAENAVEEAVNTGNIPPPPLELELEDFEPATVRLPCVQRKYG